jgi:rhamnose utilization protein RhaD (predicted bifunctional aldolase and dehydrogenase)/NAD(P)-dependent dehydrogenase (short-subunit alcohol dehydrogenase family)
VDEADARARVPDRDGLDALVSVSRSLGSDPELVLHGGGNTSLKVDWVDATGAVVPALLIKASGHDLSDLDVAGLAPLRLDRLHSLLPPVRLDERSAWNELRCAALDADAPDPSVETLVHALIPHRAVLHTHADALLTITNTPDGEERIRGILRDRVVVVRYAMPGPELVAACAEAWERESHAETLGIVVLQHGVFAVGDDPVHARERHDTILDEIRAALRERAVTTTPAPRRPGPERQLHLARLRRDICAVAGHALVTVAHGDDEARSLAGGRAASALTRGPITPDHAIWTKAFPATGPDVEVFSAAYQHYLDTYRHRVGPHALLVDTAPRVVLDGDLGIVGAGRTAHEARAAAEITRHALRVAEAAEDLSSYAPAELHHVFDLEHWGPQQAKLRRSARGGALSGRVAVVTGAASGIGRACAEELLAEGAAVVGWDLAEHVPETFSGPAWLGLRVDVTDEHAVAHALEVGIEAFGGLDVLIVSAGVFPRSEQIADLTADDWRRTMAVNVDSVAMLYQQAAPLLRLAVGGGDVVVVASKNVIAPGRGAAAYSASKAALTQLSRVAALEWAAEGIRVNMVHPDAVFDTGLWTAELLETRAAHYGLSVEDYKRRNLLRTEVTSRTVARMVRAMADGTFVATTGAQVAVDGGSERTL